MMKWHISQILTQYVMIKTKTSKDDVPLHNFGSLFKSNNNNPQFKFIFKVSLPFVLLVQFESYFF